MTAAEEGGAILDPDREDRWEKLVRDIDAYRAAERAAIEADVRARIAAWLRARPVGDWPVENPHGGGAVRLSDAVERGWTEAAAEGPINRDLP